jgi:hypothetical protein
MEDKKEKKETKTQEQLVLNALDPEQAKKVNALFNAVSRAKVNSFVAKELGSNFNGSEFAIFNLGVVSGENNIIRQLKAIIGQEQ